MKNLILIVIASRFVVTAFSDCKSKPSAKAVAATQTAIDSFTLTYEEGLDTCTATLVKNIGIDSVTARKRCVCMYESYTEIDSTFPPMDPDQRQEFMTAHRDEVIRKCDNLVPAEKSKIQK